MLSIFLPSRAALAMRATRDVCPAIIVVLSAIGVWCAAAPPCVFAEVWSTESHADHGTMEIKLREKPFATYSFRDPAISRPYFANVFAPSGVKITRNHPPSADDPQDHEKLHPGVWLAFGDLSGADSWRLAAPIEHVRFASLPQAKDATLTFAVENKYLGADGSREICRETCNYAFQALSHGVLMSWDSTFHSAAGSFVFGDQEELGLGVRLARPIAVKSGLGGRILNSNGQRNEEEAWGQQAEWCDYSGTVSDQYVGIMLMPHPANFRKAWCHARNTGFMAMNPFGRNAFTGEEKSSIAVGERETFRLRYGVLFHWNDEPSEFNPEQVYREYLHNLDK
jgi:hypothetical protein